MPPNQEKALDIIRAIREALPKDNSGGGQGQQQNQQQNQQQDKNQNQQQEQQQQDGGDKQESDQRQDQAPQQQEGGSEEQRDGEGSQDNPDDEELQAIFKKAQERSDEHEAEEKARMRKAPTRPDERDW